ncbi:hypothetical protein BIY24_07990 [Halobacteriovorax marinus]|uniref:hypothetical protein n=1 Tax=Halobacteriovorax marinus TaxID=97084 RepID=UPI000BC2D355|nr:hypothetical protein [Halobacteriovorax marinus]ATH07891.1 hypothetical protein BIY24_07990 [Halobacteriovorax marinus]
MDLIRRKKSILNFKQLKEIGLRSSLINCDGPFLIQKSKNGKQILKSSDPFERNLFKKSQGIFGFRENVILRVKTIQGTSIESNILKGEFDSFKNMELLEREIRSLDFKVRKNSFDIAYFEIIHTHPTGCYLQRDDEYEVISLGGLSEADYMAANYLSEKYGYHFKLKAICPGEITYCSA